MTWLKALNLIVLQWIGFRLARMVDEETGEQCGWAVIGPVVPLSGWWFDYVGFHSPRLRWVRSHSEAR